MVNHHIYFAKERFKQTLWPTIGTRYWPASIEQLGYGSGTVTRLVEQTPNASPSYLSTSGVTLGGQTFDTSTDGTIQGTACDEIITPSDGVYSVAMPSVSASLITITHN